MESAEESPKGSVQSYKYYYMEGMYDLHEEEDNSFSLSPEPWYWWLRSTFSDELLVRIVEKNGKLGTADPLNSEMGIRPAIWIEYKE